MGLSGPVGGDNLDMETEPTELQKMQSFLTPRTYPFDVVDPVSGEKFHFVFEDKSHAKAYDEIGNAKAETPEQKMALTYRAIALAIVEPAGVTPEDLELGRRSIVDQLVQKYNGLFLSERTKLAASAASSSSATSAP